MTRHLFVHDQEKWEAKYAQSYLLTEEPAQAPVYENAIVLPARLAIGDKKVVYDGVYEGGVCTEGFEFVAGHVRKPGHVSNLDCQGAYEVAPDQVEKRDEVAVFGGVLITHFGHMLIDCSARLWYLARTDDYDKVVFVKYDRYRPVQCDPLMIVRAMGIPEEKIEVIERPTQFKRVIIPDEAFCPLAGYRAEFIEAFRAICARIPAGEDKKVYLSRSRFANDEMINEKLFERFYERRGYRIAYPETLSFEEQIALVSGADELVMTSGTLAHWILFAKPDARVTVLNRRGCVVPQILVEQACDMRCFYVDVGTNPLPVSHVKGPFFLEPNRFFRGYLNEARIAYDPEEFEQEDARPELMYRFLKKWLEVYDRRAASLQIKGSTVQHVFADLYEFFNDAEEPWKADDALPEERQFEELYIDLKNARKQNIALKEKNATLKEKNRACKQEIKDLKKWNRGAAKRSQAKIEKAQKRNAALKKRAEKAEAEVKKIRGSKSWKITAPLRRLGRRG